MKTITRFVLITMLPILIASNVRAADHTPPGIISVNTTWDYDNVYVDGDLVIDENATLTIMPGTNIVFQGHFSILVLGAIQAVGSQGNIIQFTIDDNTGFSNNNNTDGAWSGIKFINTTGPDSSIIKHCRIEYVKNLEDPDPDLSGGAITINGYSKLVIEDCEFWNNTGYYGGAVYCLNDQRPMINNNLFQNCKAISLSYFDGSGGAIYCQGASPQIIGNDFKFNNGRYGGAIYSTEGNPLIHGNVFYETDGNNAVQIMSSIWNIACEDNKILNSQNEGLYIDGTDVTLVNNLICNNAKSGIRLNESTAQILNNTIVGNGHTSNNNGGGIQAWGADLTIVNSILGGNTAVYGPQIFIDKFSQAFIRHCDIEGDSTDIYYSSGIAEYTNNISADPVFTLLHPDGLLGDFTLTENSPCVNKGNNTPSGIDLRGNDLNGDIRIRHGIVDIGAYEKHIPVITAAATISGDTEWIADTVFVDANLSVDETSVLSIVPGCKVIVTGQYTITIFGALIAKGLEDAPILFTSNDTAGISTPETFTGGWYGITFLWDTGFAHLDTSILQYCIFENVCLYDDPWNHQIILIGAIPMMEIDHVEFRNNIGNHPATNFGIVLSSSSARISNCKFYDNIFTGPGALISSSNSTAELSDNIFFNNHAQSANMIHAKSKSFLELNRNQFYNNYSELGNIALFESSNINIKNVLFFNNHSGIGGIQFNSSQASIINSTIVNNYSDQFGALTFEGITTPELINNILSGNENLAGQGAQVYFHNKNATPSFEYCNIQGGKDDLGHPGILNPNFTYDYCIDTISSFTNPTIQSGTDDAALQANWSLFGISPCINTGKIGITVQEAGYIDYYHNPRIHFNRIDMGAIENQGSIPSISLQPVNITLCSGEPMLMQIVCSDTANYQWQKNGVDLPGETTNKLIIDEVSTSDQGNYWCVLSNSNGSVTSNTAILFVNEIPEFLQYPQDMWSKPGNTVTLRTYARGTSLNYQWQKDGIDISGEVTPDLNIPDVAYSDEGAYRCVINNVCGSDVTSSADLYVAPQICMVTFSTATGDNLVVWEKQTSAPLDFYKVYRESQAAGIYNLLDTVYHSDLSVYIDTTADPTVQAYLYKISGVDVSGFETDLDLCNPHKTIHLLVSTNPELNTTQLEWDRYYGFYYSTYIIFRSPTGVGYSPIHYMSSTLNSWTDPSPLPDVGFYRIGVEKPDPCVPAGGGKKADAGPYSHAMSNTEDNRLQEQGNQPPDSILLTSNSVDENLPPGSVVGRIETTDPDTSDYHVYKLVAGDGNVDNFRFTTLGDLLITAEEFDYEAIDTCYVRIKTTDKGDLSYEQAFIVVVNDVDETIPNEAPTGLTLSSNSIAENMPAGSMVGRLWTDDPDEIDDHTYSLVSGEGSDDNGSFMVLSDLLLSDAAFDYETQDTFKVRIRSTDQGDLSIEAAFIITITDVNEGGGNLAPTAISLNANSIEENRQSGTLIGAFTTTDPDAGDMHAYALVDGLGADDNDDFMIMGNILISAVEFDYETEDSLFVRVASSDPGGLSFEAAFVILVSDVFEAEPNLSPTDILLTSDAVDENMPALTMIGRLQTTDPNMDDLHSYLLAEGGGDDDNSSFVIVGDVVFSTVIFDYEMKDEYTIRVKTIDDGEGELTTEKSFTIVVNDLLELGVNDLQDNPGRLSIYPNPFTHTAMIQFPNPDNEKYRMYITDLAGKVIYLNENIYTDRIEFNRKDLPAGVYFVEMIGNSTYRGRVIVE